MVKISGFLTDPDSPVSSGRWHARTEAALRASAVGCTFLRAPFFMQNLLHSGPHALRAGEIALPLNRARVAMVDARDLARVAAALLDRGPDGGTYLVTGAEALDFHEVAHRLSRHTGRCVRLRTTTPAETRIALAEAGTPPWRIDLLMEFYEAFEQQRGETVTDVVETVTGIAAATLDAFLASADARAVLAPADAGRK